MPSDTLEPGQAIEPRAGDSDREAVAERLRVAAGEGRIDLAELDERLGRTYQARTYRELDVLVADLILPADRAARIGPASTNTGHISNQAAAVAGQGRRP